MRLLLFTFTIILNAGIAQATDGSYNSPRPQVLYANLVGKPYSRARSALLAMGDIPVDVRKQQSQVQDPPCDFDDKFCGYRELTGCAADIYDCVLDWKERSGRSFHVQVDVTPHGPHSKQGPDPRVDAIWEEP